jgi:hypothetical protein
MMCFDHRPFGTLTLRVLPAVLLACGAVWTCVRGPDWSAAPGIDQGCDPEVRRAAKLDEDLQAVGQRIDDKMRLAEEVAEGRLTLLAAAARFRDLDRAPPAFQWEMFRMTYDGQSDDERHCREVIGFVGSALINQPETGNQVVARLRADLAHLLEQGEIRLP